MNTDNIRSHWNKATNSLKSSQLLLKNDMYDDAVSRAYYAILHAAQSVLLTKDIKAKSHRSVRTLFGKHFILTDIIENEFSQILSELQDIRFITDYSEQYFITDEIAEENVEQAIQFVERMKTYLISQSIELP